MSGHRDGGRAGPWCIRYTDPASVGSRTYVHPAIAYEMLLDLAILALRLARTPWASQPHRIDPMVVVGLAGLAWRRRPAR